MATNKFLNNLPFRKLAEKIFPAETRAKHPVLNRMIPNANKIVVGIVLVIAVIVIGFSGGFSTENINGFFDKIQSFSGKIQSVEENIQKVVE